MAKDWISDSVNLLLNVVIVMTCGLQKRCVVIIRLRKIKIICSFSIYHLVDCNRFFFFSDAIVTVSVAVDFEQGSVVGFTTSNDHW